MATPVIIEVKANTAQAKREFNSLGTSMRNFGASIRSVVAMSSQAVTGIRQMAQGVQNLGFTMSAMIGLPMAAALKNVANEAMSFEKSLVEVEKTTGIAKDEVAKLGEEIRQLALHTPTGAQELAQLAAEAGRAGVGLGQTLAGNIEGARAEILEFVRVMDMMQVSTNLTGEDAAKAFSRFITLFEDIRVDNIEELGSAINELGQATSVAEDEIVGAMLRIAPAASTLRISAADTAALATAITQMSESMSRGGTRVRVALEQMALNYKDAAKLIGISSAEMAERINKDALPTFMELVYAVSQIEDSTKQLEVATEIFGTTGANAVQRFAAAFPELQKYIELSNASFEQGSSLQTEFDRALTATSAQFDILKNNITEVGLTFANDLLPVAQEIISAIIPAIQELNKWVGSLTVEQKALAVAIVGLVTVGLPLLALLGSLGFGFAMIINGAVNLIGGLVGLIATIVTFGGGLSALGTALGVIAALVGGVLVAKLLTGADAFNVILEKLREVANGAIDWGEGLIANVAEGIISGAANFLVKALEFVGNLISDYLMPGSPPKTGPLSTINEWGSRLIDVYLQSFKNADFGILKDVAGIISDVLQTMVDIGKIEELDFGPMLADARTFVSELISIFNSTGVIAEDVLSKIGDMLGGAGDEVVKLLRLQLQYNKALQDLENIRQKTSDIEESYQAEARAIAARTDLTEVEKMQAIRAAKKRRDLALSNAKTEQSVAQDNVDSLKTEVEWQREYINAMQEQDDVLTDHLKMIEKLNKAIKNVGRSIKSLGQKIADLIADLLRQLEVNERLKELYESKGMDTTPLLRKELSLRKRLVQALLEKKLMYEDMNKELPEEEWLSLTPAEEAMLDANLDRIKELELHLDSLSSTSGIEIPPMDTSSIDEGKEVIVGAIEDLTNLGQTVANVLKEGPKLWEAFKAGISGEIGFDIESISPEMLMDMDPSVLKDAFHLDESSSKFYEWGAKLRNVWDKVKGTLDEIVAKFNLVKEKVKVAWESLTGTIEKSGITDETTDIGNKFKKVVPIIVAFGAALFLLRSPLLGLASWLASPMIVGKFGDAFGKLTAEKGPLGRLLKWSKDSTGIFPLMGKAMKGVGKGVNLLSLAVAGINHSFSELYLKVGQAIGAGSLGGLKKVLGIDGLAKKFGGNIAKMAGSVKGFGRNLALSMAQGSKKFVTFLNVLKGGGVKAAFSGLGGAMKGGIGGLLGVVKGGLGPVLSALAGGAGSIISTIGPVIAMVVKFVGAFTLIGGAIAAAIAAIAATVKYMKDNWSKFEGTFVKIWENIKSAVQGFANAFKKALGITGGEGINFKEILEEIYRKAEPVAKFLAGAFTKALHVISGLLKIILPALGKAFGGVFRGIIAVAAGVLDILGGIFKFIEAIWKGISTGNWDMLKDAWEKIKEGILEILGGLVSAIGGVFSGAIDVVLGIIESIIDGIQNIFGRNKILRGISDFITKVIGFFERLYNKLVGGSIIPDLVNGIKAWFKKLLKPFQPVINAIKKLIDYFEKVYKVVFVAFKKGGAEKGFVVLRKVLAPFKKILGPVIDMFENLYNVVAPLINAVKTGFAEGGFSGAFEKIKEALPEVVSSLGKLVGSMMTMVPKMLIGLAQMLWPWITGTLIPWVTSVVSTVWSYLKENVPVWITAIIGVLGDLASKLWAWITETLLPWVIDLAGKVASYLAEHVPQWIKTIVGVLKMLAGKLWEFITGTLIPWAVDVIKKVFNILKEKGPGWWEKIKEILGTIATALWNFIKDDLIPWIVQTIKDVVAYIKEHGPEWLAAIADVLLKIGSALWSWITETVIPWLSEIISAGLTWFGKIATDWWLKIKNGLDKIKNYFVEIFDLIKEIVMSSIKGAINGMIKFLERGINGIIEGINKFIDTVNQILRGLGIPELGKLSKVRIPRLAKGGIALSEQLAIVGDVPEAIIPLDRLPDLMGNAGGDQRPVHIEIKDNVIRRDDDITAMMNELERRLGLKLGYKATNLGRGII